jgi:hypothetical protein
VLLCIPIILQLSLISSGIFSNGNFLQPSLSQELRRIGATKKSSQTSTSIDIFVRRQLESSVAGPDRAGERSDGDIESDRLTIEKFSPASS